MKYNAKMSPEMLKAFLSHYFELLVARVIMIQILPRDNPKYPLDVTLIALQEKDVKLLEAAFTHGPESMRVWQQYFKQQD